MFRPRQWVSLGLLGLLVTACNARYPETCPAHTPIGLVMVDEIASDVSLPFRFPLDESAIDDARLFGWFGVSNECPPKAENCFAYPEREFHAAEDYKRPAGTPVYAIAEGRISFSGTAGGYGWLIIIDHPQANLYSLYGHLSPSRWKLSSGAEVTKGELIAYLGDPDENGGSAESPLEPHLHLGLRAGQRADYPPRGEWRWMAGWIRLCPQDLGWLQPSLVITSQAIPVGGYPQPQVDFLIRWGGELLITSLYAAGGAGMLAVALRKKWRLFLVFPGVVVTAAGIVFHTNGMASTYALFAIGIFLTALGGFQYVRRSTPQARDQETRS